MSRLEARNLSVRYGGVTAVDGVDIAVDGGSIVAVIGANGAGKSTLLDALSGTGAATGTVALDGRDLSRAPAHTRARHGLVRTFQMATLLTSLTVRDNLRLAARASQELPRPGEHAVAHPDDRVAAVAELVGAGGWLDRLADDLTGVERRLVDLGAALLLRPRVLLVDEPAAAASPTQRAHIAALLRWCRDRLGLGVLLVEHDVALVMDLADRVDVLDRGKVIASGPPHEIRGDARVARVYLGGSGGKVLAAL